jgi:hypothetical protein
VATISGEKKVYSDNLLSLSYPATATLQQNPGYYLRIYQHGSTQSKGTELYDGLSITVDIFDNKNKKDLKTLVDESIESAKQDAQIMKQPEVIRINKNSGYTYSMSGLGEATYYDFLTQDKTTLIRIVDGTVEPENQTRNFKQTAQSIIQSLQIMK